MNLGTIQELYTHTGPFVTLHTDVSRTTEDAAQQLDARWTSTRHELERAEVDPALIDRIEQRLREQPDVSGEVRRTLVAADGEIVFDDVRSGHTPWPETLTVGALPDLSGWLHQVEGEIPFLLVVADREGADLEFYRARSRPDVEQREVTGETLHITRSHPGGWRQKQYQQRAENVWERNAREVAEEIRSLCVELRPRVVVLAGDPRARTEIVDALEGMPCGVEQVQGGGRGAGASDEALWNDVRLVLARLEAGDQREVTERLREKVGQGGAATYGLHDVLDALVQGKVERLVVDLEATHAMSVDPTSHPGLELPSSAAVDEKIPADQVLVAMGAATDAELSVLPKEQTPGDGVAALLRWTD